MNCKQYSCNSKSVVPREKNNFLLEKAIAHTAIF